MINKALHGSGCGPQRRSGRYIEYKNNCCYQNQVQTLSSPHNITILTPLPCRSPHCTLLIYEQYQSFQKQVSHPVMKSEGSCTKPTVRMKVTKATASYSLHIQSGRKKSTKYQPTCKLTFVVQTFEFQCTQYCTICSPITKAQYLSVCLFSMPVGIEALICILNN